MVRVNWCDWMVMPSISFFLVLILILLDGGMVFVCWFGTYPGWYSMMTMDGDVSVSRCGDGCWWCPFLMVWSLVSYLVRILKMVWVEDMVGDVQASTHKTMWQVITAMFGEVCVVGRLIDNLLCTLLLVVVVVSVARVCGFTLHITNNYLCNVM